MPRKGLNILIGRKKLKITMLEMCQLSHWWGREDCFHELKHRLFLCLWQFGKAIVLLVLTLSGARKREKPISAGDCGQISEQRAARAGDSILLTHCWALCSEQAQLEKERR